MVSKPVLPALNGDVTADGDVVLTWTQDADPALVKGYQAQYCPHGTSAWKNLPMPVSMSVSGLPKGIYDFRLVAMSSTMGYNLTATITETVSGITPSGSPFSVAFSPIFGVSIG
jgi:hypothetical protein